MTVSPSTGTSCTGHLPGSKHIRARIIEQREVGPRVFRVDLDARELARAVRPGQFVHVLVTTPEPVLADPLLRRPLGIHAADPATGHVALLYEVRGRGTQLLSERCAGQYLDILGPLGNGFTLPESCDQPVILVAGGIAVSPLYFLASTLAEKIGPECLRLIIGARTAELHVCYEEFGALCHGDAYGIATDDGTLGHPGFVTDLLADHLKRSGPSAVYACGPMPMLKKVAALTKEHGVKCQVSTEAKMACGVGACMSCVIPVHKDGGIEYARSCHEGPVFDAERIVW